MTHFSERRSRIAGEIRAELGRQGKSRHELAAAAGISPATLSRRLQGKKPFYLEELEAIAQFLEIRLSDLTERTEDAA